MVQVTELDTLADLESVIERGIGTFIEVGNALLAIRDGKLYRETGYATFDAYCQERWGFSRRTGYDLMATAEAAQIVQEVAQTERTPTREQARALSPLAKRDPAEASLP